MTRTHTWTLSALAALALVAGALLATGAIGSAQEATPTATPSPTEEADDGTATATPEATEDADKPTETPAPEGDDDTDGDNSGDGSEDSTDNSGSGHWCGGGANPVIFDNAAEILGMTQEELRAAKQSGQSLADLAVAQGMTVEDFTAQLQTAATADLQAQLAAGEITQEQFDAKSANLSENLDAIINSTGGGLGFGGHRGPGGGEGDGSGGTLFRAPFDNSGEGGTDA